MAHVNQFTLGRNRRANNCSRTARVLMHPRVELVNHLLGPTLTRWQWHVPSGGSCVDFLSKFCDIIAATKIKLALHAFLLSLSEETFDCVFPGHIFIHWMGTLAIIQLCGSVDGEVAKYYVRKFFRDLWDWERILDPFLPRLVKRIAHPTRVRVLAVFDSTERKRLG